MDRDSTRWHEVERIFQSALEVDEAQRPAFLDQACRYDDELRDEIESLLGFTAKSGSFLETPALEANHIGPYRIIREIAAGGMGVVYEAEQQSPRRIVALKVLRGVHGTDATRVALFEREVATLARLRHPGIASIIDAGTTGRGEHYFAMELVDGETLGTYSRRPELSLRDRLALFLHVCAPVSYAHQRGVIHRDLKPANILVIDETMEMPSNDDAKAQMQSARDSGSDGAARSAVNSTAASAKIKILDFGLARFIDDKRIDGATISGAGQIAGTLNYMSPEQTGGACDEIDIRSDVYSLGIILYEFLTGRVPIDVRSMALHDAVRSICEDRPGRPSAISRELRGDIDNIVLKSIEKNPNERYQSVAELIEDVRRYLNGQPILAHPPSSLYQIKKLVARHKILFSAAVASFAILIGFFLTVSILATRLATKRHEAVVAREKERESRLVSERISGFLEDMLASARPENAKGRDVSVLEILDLAAARLDAEWSVEPAVAAAIQETLGKTYHSLGRIDDAESQLRVALERRRADGEDASPGTISCMNSLAMLLIDRAKFDEAGALCDAALAATMRLTDDNDQDREQRETLNALCLNTRASLRMETGDAAGALEDLEESLRIRRRIHGERHLDVATCLSNLAALHQSQGRFEDAEVRLQQALSIREERLGDVHPDVATSLNNLAMFHWEQGDYAEAEAGFEKVLAIQKKLLRERHPLVAATLNNLALTMKAMGNVTDAESYYRQAIDVQIEVLGEDHPAVAQTRNNLGILLYARGELESSEKMLRQSLKSRQATFHGDHIEVAKNMNDLAAVIAARGNIEDAEALYHEAIRMMSRAVGEKHPRVGGLLNNLASLLLSNGRPAEAESLYRKSDSILRQALHETHPYRVMPLLGLGRTLLQLGRPADALPSIKSAYEIQMASQNFEAVDLARTESLIGMCLDRLDRHDESLETYDRALERLSLMEDAPMDLSNELLEKRSRVLEKIGR